MLVQSKTLGIINDKYVEAIYESSNILMSTYFPEKNKLFIHFSRGGTYSYSNINESLYVDFEKADSQGKFFIANIKKNPDNPSHFSIWVLIYSICCSISLRGG